jgi:dihydroorotase
VIIRNASVLNQEGQLETRHIVVQDGVISAIESNLDALDESTEIIEAEGKLLIPGLIDMHVHLREPGFEHKETVETGARSAAKGGFTTIACMPNTRPVTDSPEIVQFVKDKAREAGLVKVLPYAAITKNELGRELTDFAALKEA